MKKLVIIDGKSVFYRGYYAMGNLSRKDGTPTGGVYGFAAIAMEIVKRLGPDKVVIAWDKAKTSISKRKAIYAEYKAGRVRPPEDFFVQIPLLMELAEALSWEFVECDDYEADDIIGTLAKQAQAADYETVIVSSDLDMLQVVGERVKMWRLMKGFSEIEEVETAEIEAKYGILKEQFLDLKALKGDASDNIPGVPGIGEKGAVKLLNQYGSLAGIYEHLTEIGGATGKKLAAGEESALMSLELARIMTDAPVKLTKMREFELDREKVRVALEGLEFYSLIRKFGLGKKLEEDEKRTRGDEGESDKMRQDESAGAVKAEKMEEVSENYEIIPEGMILEWDVKQKMHAAPEIAERILAGAKFYDLGQGRFLLDPLERDKNYAYDGIKEQEYRRQKLEYKKYSELSEILEKLDLPLIPVLFKMEKRGMKIDQAEFARMETEISKEVTEIAEKIYALSGIKFNINSPLQLSEVLFNKLGLSTKGIKKTTRGYSTGASELEKLAEEHEIIDLIREYREKSKLMTTYIVPLPKLADEKGRIHTTFTQNVTATGRLSSLAPNLQNIPVRTEEGRRIREGFVAEEGKVLVAADYAQFELRLAAVLAGDERLMADFNEGVDIHTKTAAEVFNVPMAEVSAPQRRAAKTINFGVLYGMSPRGLAVATDMGFYEAKRFIEDYFKVRWSIREYLDEVLKMAREKGYVETLMGRRRPTPDVLAANFVVRTGAERAAMNMPIQGTEADLMKKAMIAVDAALPEGAGLVCQVHDSMIVECEESQAAEVAEILRREMEGVCPELPVKLAVDVKIGKNWGEL